MSAENGPAPSTSRTHPPASVGRADESPPPNPETAPGECVARTERRGERRADAEPPDESPPPNPERGARTDRLGERRAAAEPPDESPPPNPERGARTDRGERRAAAEPPDETPLPNPERGARVDRRGERRADAEPDESSPPNPERGARADRRGDRRAAAELPDESPAGGPAATPADRGARLARLGDRIAELSARIQAATYELLVLIREFDEQEGWDGCLTCAHWLSWRAGLSPGAAREHVRVARALGELPKLSDAMRRGKVSYSKVRAVTRVATPENEQSLLDVALAGTAAHVERIARAWRRIDRNVEQAEERRQQASRELRTWVDEDGMVVVRGRLTPEVGAVLRRALEAACDQARRAPASHGGGEEEAADGSAGGDREAAAAPVGGDREAAAAPVGGDREAAAAPVGGDREAAAAPVGGDREAAAAPVGGDREAAAAPVGGDREAAAAPVGGDREAAAAPVGGDREAAAAPVGGDREAAAAPVGGDREAAAAPVGGDREAAAESSGAPAGAEEPTLAQRQADAIGTVAEAALAGGLDRGTAGDRYQVVLHVDAEALGERRDVPAGTSEGVAFGSAARTGADRVPAGTSGGVASGPEARAGGDRVPAGTPAAAHAAAGGPGDGSPMHTPSRAGRARHSRRHRTSGPCPGARATTPAPDTAASAPDTAASAPDTAASAPDTAASAPTTATTAASAPTTAASAPTTAVSEPSGAHARPSGPARYARRPRTSASTPSAAKAAGSQTVLDEAGGIHVSAETARRLACDAATVTMRHGPGGEILDVGRRTRTISPALRRALAARDRQCRFPGCGNVRGDVHHVKHWAHGGRTALDNLVLLCRRHHRAVHEEGFRVTLDADGGVQFEGPDGRPLPEAPPSPAWAGPALQPTNDDLAAAGIEIDADTATPSWRGERLDLDYAMSVLWRPRREPPAE